MGYAQLDGQQEKYIGTIAHLDVVPAGNGWHNRTLQHDREVTVISWAAA
mgnify:CR=1 FL=1